MHTWFDVLSDQKILKGIYGCIRTIMVTQNQAYDLPARTLSYPPGLDSRYRLHKKAKFCSFMNFSQMTPFFMSHYGNF